MDGNMKPAEKVQVVINTLKLLIEVRDEIHGKEAAKDAGEADAE